MAINAELQKWLVDKLTPHLADQEKQTLESILAKDAAAQVFNEGLAGRSEINRRLDEIRLQEQQIVDRANQELQQHVNTLQQWQQAESQKNIQLQNQLAALQKQLNDEGLVVPQTPPPVPQAPQTNGNGKYLSQEDVARIVNAELSKAAYLPAVTLQIAEQHRTLFGSTPDMAKVTDSAMKTGRSLNEVWREMYKVGDREAQLQEETIQKRIQEGINAELAKRVADGSINQQNFTGRTQSMSPLRQMMQAQREANPNLPLATPAPVMQRSQGVQDAEAAYARGDYEHKYPGRA